MHRLLSAVIILTCVVCPLAIATVVFAIDNPDSSPSIDNIRVNRYLSESGDVLIYGDYNIPYATPPDEGADDAYVFRLLNGDVELGSVQPYVLMDNGYNLGVFSFYFSAADNLTWGQAYTIRISQNPSQFDSPTSDDFVIPLGAYTSRSTQVDNQNELTINIINAAQRLETFHTDYTFLDSGAGGTVLSSPTGETYFRGAIYGIQEMAPDLFLTQVLDIAGTDREWTTAQFDTYLDRFDGTWVGEDIDAGAAQAGLTPQFFMGMLFCLPLSIGSIIVSSMKWKRAEPGFVATAIFLIMGGMMGWLPLAIFAGIYQAMGIYIAYVWFYARG